MPTTSQEPPQYVIGIDLGGTKTSAIAADFSGQILAEVTVPTPAASGGEAMLDTMGQVVDQLRHGVGAGPDAVGVGAAGVIDPSTGRVISASDSFTGWKGFSLGERLADLCGTPVVVENDVNAFLAGELAYGAARGSQSVLALALGTGVGGALAFDGQIFTGMHGAAGEIGHTPGYGSEPCTCGQSGHLESVASGLSIHRRYLQAGGTEPVASTAGIAQAARAGDPIAAQVFADAAAALAQAIVATANLVDLDRVVIGGGVLGAWDMIGPHLEQAMGSTGPISGFPVLIRPSRLGGHAAALGAAALAWQLISNTEHDQKKVQVAS
ncbi:ROK family protein [Arthrobacter sp. 179]|uniref:ROK family protein n=1 Tax=Arthrobacter sp. 179 TaxID=3457734 RepID=UPI0040332A4D